MYLICITITRHQLCLTSCLYYVGLEVRIPCYTSIPFAWRLSISRTGKWSYEWNRALLFQSPTDGRCASRGPTSSEAKFPVLRFAALIASQLSSLLLSLFVAFFFCLCLRVFFAAQTNWRRVLQEAGGWLEAEPSDEWCYRSRWLGARHPHHRTCDLYAGRPWRIRTIRRQLLHFMVSFLLCLAAFFWQEQH